MNINICIAFAIISNANAFVKDGQAVITPLGEIQGVPVRASTDKEADAFLGVPYAEPPTGLNRFLPPREKKPWNNTFVANELPKSCVQFNLQKSNNGTTPWWVPTHGMSEDCLYLNIWVPRSLSEKTAVMVWIHGGGFAIGASNIAKFDGAVLATEEHVIVVTINYRLNIFGFLTLSDSDAKGNMGLLDQVEALQWLRKNIESFGGDKERVTLFGVSAGGMSGALHIVSSQPQLLHAVIIQSGVPETDDALNSFKGQVVDKDEAFASIIDSLNCSGAASNQAIVDCLRDIEPDDLLAQVPFMGYSFLPVTDGRFLEEDYKILKIEKHFQNVSVILGDTKQDGSVFASFYNPEVCSASGNCYLNRSSFSLLVSRLVPQVGAFVHNAIDFTYTDWFRPNDPVKARDDAMRMYTDFFTTCSTNNLANKLVEGDRTVFQYQFSHTPSVSETPVEWLGAFHGSDVDFVFGTPLNPSYGFNGQEIALSKRIMRYWANFAKYKDPNGNSTSTPSDHPYWPKYTIDDKNYANIATNVTIEKGLRVRECAFWDVAFPELLRVETILKRNDSCL